MTHKKFLKVAIKLWSLKLKIQWTSYVIFGAHLKRKLINWYRNQKKLLTVAWRNNRWSMHDRLKGIDNKNM